MFTKYFLLALITLLIVSSAAFGDGNFNGFVLYPKVGETSCEWNNQDQLIVYNTSNPEIQYEFDITCCFVPSEGYAHGIFETSDFPPGTYVLEADLHLGSGCMVTLPPKQVTHGAGDQYVTLKVVAKTQGQGD